MEIDTNILTKIERIVFTLRSLYMKNGYENYKMAKFEEYDLYSRYKDFLVSDRVITFTDADGRLMALRPDVTLSIIKDAARSSRMVKKVCYNENVYRIIHGAYKEIMQSGVECIGRITKKDISDVLMLAARSLESISKESTLDISHIGLLYEFAGYMTNDADIQRQAVELVSAKNINAIEELIYANGISPEFARPLLCLVNLRGHPKDIMPEVKAIAPTRAALEAADELESVLIKFNESDIEDIAQVDFSVVGSSNYYNGIVFEGFIRNVPEIVLSGGQYDRLLKKMHSTSSAIGFAVYLDALERLNT